MRMGKISPPNFVYDFSRKMCLMLRTINWPNFIVWLSLLLEILGNMCIAIVCDVWGCDVINLKLNLSFKSSRFSTCPKIQDKNFKYLEREKSIKDKIKSIFHHFQRVFSFQNLSQTWQSPFKTKLAKARST